MMTKLTPELEEKLRQLTSKVVDDYDREDRVIARLCFGDGFEAGVQAERERVEKMHEEFLEWAKIKYEDAADYSRRASTESMSNHWIGSCNTNSSIVNKFIELRAKWEK